MFDLRDIAIGESIAVNGVCLTVESGSAGVFTAYASAETLRHTTIGALKPGDRVNLERALAVGDRLGGHMVSGHVDCVAKILFIRQEGDSRCIRLNFPPVFAMEIISKGSVALDGISLTVNDCKDEYLEVNVIPETWRVTTVGGWQTGTCVNLETDIIGKYVRHMLRPYLPRQNFDDTGKSGIDMNFLRESGFF
jgi:riboflavin synthase